jgi:hypothetical protein
LHFAGKLHLAGASLSCPQNFFNEKASILHAPKKFGGRTFLKQVEPSISFLRAVRSPSPLAAAAKTSLLENSTAEFFTCRGIGECFRVDHHEGSSAAELFDYDFLHPIFVETPLP